MSQQLLHLIFPILAVLSLLALQAVSDNLFRPGVQYTAVVSAGNFDSICSPADGSVPVGQSSRCTTVLYAPSGVDWVTEVMESAIQPLSGDKSPSTWTTKEATMDDVSNSNSEENGWLTPLPFQADRSDQRWCLSGPGTTEYRCPGSNCTAK